MTSHVERTMDRLREAGLEVWKVEVWRPFFRGRDGDGNMLAKGGVRQDMFGAFDILAIDPDGKQLFVQVCADGEIDEHLEKMRKSEACKRLVGTGEPRVRVRCELWIWGKRKVGRRSLWRVRRMVLEPTGERMIYEPDVDVRAVSA